MASPLKCSEFLKSLSKISLETKKKNPYDRHFFVLLCRCVCDFTTFKNEITYCQLERCTTTTTTTRSLSLSSNPRTKKKKRTIVVSWFSWLPPLVFSISFHLCTCSCSRTFQDDSNSHVLTSPSEEVRMMMMRRMIWMPLEVR